MYRRAKFATRYLHIAQRYIPTPAEIFSFFLTHSLIAMNKSYRNRLSLYRILFPLSSFISHSPYYGERFRWRCIFLYLTSSTIFYSQYLYIDIFLSVASARTCPTLLVSSLRYLLSLSPSSSHLTVHIRLYNPQAAGATNEARSADQRYFSSNEIIYVYILFFSLPIFYLVRSRRLQADYTIDGHQQRTSHIFIDLSLHFLETMF